jgi:hypothetical protein
MKDVKNRAGFAMPLVVFVLIVITVGVATSFTRVQSDIRGTQDREADAQAYTYAQSGLERFSVERRSLGFTSTPPAVVESVRITLPHGHVDVVARRVKPKTDSTMAVYLLKAKSSYQAGSMAWMPRSEYVVTQYAHFREGKMKVLSAWTSLSGLQKNGGAGTIDGNDNCGVEPPVAGVAVPDVPGYTQSGGASVPTGSPPIDSLGTQSQANAAVGIDWAAIISGTAFMPDYTIPPQTYPAGTYGSANWPVILANVGLNGTFTLPADGQGTLIVTGNFIINGSEKWRGVILVGGTIYANGNNNVQGAVISGLNETLGINVAQSDVGNGTKTYLYDSCAIANALNRFGTFILISKSWSNTWPNW